MASQLPDFVPRGTYLATIAWRRLGRELEALSTDTIQLLSELGRPWFATWDNVKIYVYEGDPFGDTTLFGRISSEDRGSGETVLVQVHRLREMARRLDLRVRMIVVTENNSGMRPVEARPDLVLLFSDVRAGFTRRVSFHKPNRIARAVLEAETLYEFLREARCTLHIEELNGGRAVDWRNPNEMMLLRFVDAMVSRERDDIIERTHENAIISRFLEEGRGLPGRTMFGFRWSHDIGRLAVDPETWPLVCEIHTRYHALQAAGARVSTRSLARELAAEGWKISPKQVHKVLTDEVYATGHYVQSYTHPNTKEKLEYPSTTEPLREPVPWRLFQQNRMRAQNLLGGGSTESEGLFCLAGTRIVHAHCEAELSRDGRGFRLVPDRDRGKRRSYVHARYTPDCCRDNRSFDADALERTVIRVIRALSRSSSLRQAYFALAQKEAATPALCEFGDVRALLARLRRRLGEALRAIPDGDDLSSVDLDDLLHEVRVLERRAELEHVFPRIPFMRAMHWFVADERKLADALLAVLTEEVPSDRYFRQLRHAILRSALGLVRVHFVGDRLAIEIEGAPLPRTVATLGPVSPAQLASRELQAHILAEDGWSPQHAATVPSAMADGTVAAFSSGILGETVPAWRSPIIPLEASEQSILEGTFATALADPQGSTHVSALRSPDEAREGADFEQVPPRAPMPAAPRRRSTLNFEERTLRRIVEVRMEFPASYEELGRILTEEGHRTPSGNGKWWPATVGDAIRAARERLDLTPEEVAALRRQTPRRSTRGRPSSTTPPEIRARIVHEREVLGRTFAEIASSLQEARVPTINGGTHWRASVVHRMYQRAAATRRAANERASHEVRMVDARPRENRTARSVNTTNRRSHEHQVSITELQRLADEGRVLRELGLGRGSRAAD